MKIGFSLCLLACIVSGLLADYRGVLCEFADCNYEKEACCSYTADGGSVFCRSKSGGCPPRSITIHPGFTGPEKLRETGSCEACSNSEVCCVTERTEDTERTERTGVTRCPLESGSCHLWGKRCDNSEVCCSTSSDNICAFCSDASGGRRCPKWSSEKTAEGLAKYLERLAAEQATSSTPWPGYPYPPPPSYEERG